MRNLPYYCNYIPAPPVAASDEVDEVWYRITDKSYSVADEWGDPRLQQGM